MGQVTLIKCRKCGIRQADTLYAFVSNEKTSYRRRVCDRCVNERERLRMRDNAHERHRVRLEKVAQAAIDARVTLVKSLPASEWDSYQAVLIHCLRIGDEAALGEPRRPRRLRRALCEMAKELEQVAELLN